MTTVTAELNVVPVDPLYVSFEEFCNWSVDRDLEVDDDLSVEIGVVNASIEKWERVEDELQSAKIEVRHHTVQNLHLYNTVSSVLNSLTLQAS